MDKIRIVEPKAQKLFNFGVMEKRWILKEQPQAEEIQALVEDLTVSETVAHLLLQREIKTYEDARLFFRPTLEDLHSPFLMLNMQRAVDRLNKAFEKEEKILIYGDYDVDGTSAVALVYSFLSKHYSQLEFYIPDRYAEGYGLSKKGVEYAAENGFKCIITLDSEDITRKMNGAERRCRCGGGWRRGCG